MKNILVYVLVSFSSFVFAEPLANLVSVEDGLDLQSTENIADDYIRLTLLNPSYQGASSIKLAIENWLGTSMVILDSVDKLKVQAPRDSSTRIEFVSALLALDIDT
jgi:flagellar basal body P-ring protein FlgI